ncbi:MAG TPA: hypothetical protein VF178_14940, partial [Gemmatimonadaceae bacterium]
WGVVGAAVGVATFPIRFRPWPLGAINWSRALELFQLWESGAVVWGIACGLAFGGVILLSERSRRFSQLSARRVTLWGALAGAAFPMLVSIRPIHYGASVSYFGMIVGASAVACGLWARGAIAMARRAPREPEPLMMLDGPASAGLGTVTVTRDRVR